jgi:threonine/homoserine/homoserine lactone efflux protein
MPRQAFREGVIVEALNPKTTASFLALRGIAVGHSEAVSGCAYLSVWFGC